MMNYLSSFLGLLYRYTICKILEIVRQCSTSTESMRKPLGTGDSRERPPEGREVAHHVGQPASASCSALSGPPVNHLTLELKASQSLRTNRKFNHCSKGRFLQNDWFLIEVTKKHKGPTQQSPPDVGQTLLETCSAAHHADRSASASC